MSQAAVDLPVDDAAAAAGPRARRLTSLAFVAFRRQTVEWFTCDIGRAATISIPVFGDTVVISDPVLAKQIFTTSPEVLHNIQPNLSRLLGPGSVLRLGRRRSPSTAQAAHPPFHGKSIAAYERIVEEETMREIASWPDGESSRRSSR